MKLDEKKARLKETEHKSSAPGEFEEAIAEAFKFLGLGAQLIGCSGDTDVLLTANIGNETYTVSVDGRRANKIEIQITKSIGFLFWIYNTIAWRFL